MDIKGMLSRVCLEPGCFNKTVCSLTCLPGLRPGVVQCDIAWLGWLGESVFSRVGLQ